ncbi:MAG: hypothetical protein IT340_13910 [Chloroflexi bacterium]|nr:hypothetical protein [Chloroflexota bacterium]
MPRPRDPVRVRVGVASGYEVDPDWSYYGSLIFDSRTGRHVGWVNARSQTGWQVFHTNGHLLGAVLLDGDVRDYRDALLGRVAAQPTDEQVLDGVTRILDASLSRFT